MIRAERFLTNLSFHCISPTNDITFSPAYPYLPPYIRNLKYEYHRWGSTGDCRTSKAVFKRCDSPRYWEFTISSNLHLIPINYQSSISIPVKQQNVEHDLHNPVHEWACRVRTVLYFYCAPIVSTGAEGFNSTWMSFPPMPYYKREIETTGHYYPCNSPLTRNLSFR